jgi:dolichol-phosphate mannosyltransferase
MISLVIPVYNEESLIDILFERTIGALSSITDDFEIICIDDGSSDNSLTRLMACHHKDYRFKILVLSRNFGHQSAYTAGLTYAKGDYIAMMDGDLQDPPEVIKQMYEKLINDNYDIIYGKRTARREGIGKRALIKVFHWLFKNFSKIEKADNVGNFSLMNRKALQALLSIREKNRYLPGLRFFVGYKQGFIEYKRHERDSGEAKMSFSKLTKLALDAIFSFSDLPIKFCLYTGLIGIIVFFAAGMYVLVDKFFGRALYGWSSTVLSIYFLGSVQLVFLGIIGEYVHRIYKEVQNRPLFIVREFIN